MANHLGTIKLYLPQGTVLDGIVMNRGNQAMIGSPIGPIRPFHGDRLTIIFEYTEIARKAEKKEHKTDDQPTAS